MNVVIDYNGMGIDGRSGGFYVYYSLEFLFEDLVIWERSLLCEFFVNFVFLRFD